MGKRQAKKTVGWSRLWIGVSVSAGIYLSGILLIALFMVNGFLGSEKGSLALGAWAMISAACGSVPVLRIKNVVPLVAGLLQGCAFAVVMLVVSYLCWEGPVWSRTNTALLLCALSGGLIPGVLASGKGKRKRKRGW